MKFEQVVETIHRLAEADMLWYVSSPYTNYPDGVDRAAELVAKVTGRLMERGLVTYSPVVHGHTIDKLCQLDKPHKFWMRQCKQMLLRCHGMIVVKMPGWKESAGVDLEIQWAAEHDIPAFYMDVEDII